MGCHFLLKGIFPTQRSNPGLLHCRQTLYHLSHQGDSWTQKISEHWRIHTFELWCWRRVENPLHCKEIQLVNSKGNQSWIFIGRTDAKAKFPIFWLPDVKVDSLNKTLMLGKIKGRSRRGLQRMRCLDGITDLMDMSLSKHQEMANDREAWSAAVHELTKNQTQMSEWTTTTYRINICLMGIKIVGEFGRDHHTLQYLKWITNKDFLYSAWSSAQCYVAAWMEREFRGEWIHIYVWLSSFAVH